MKTANVVIIFTIALMHVQTVFCMSPAATSSEFGALATQRVLPHISPQIYRTFGTSPSSTTPQDHPWGTSPFTRQIQQQRAPGAPTRSFVTSSSLRPSISSRLKMQPLSREFASFKAEYSYDPEKLKVALKNLSNLLNTHFKTNRITLNENSTWRDILHMTKEEIAPSAENPKKNILQNIKARYYELSKIVHTDQNKTAEASTQFVILQEAHENGIKSVEGNGEISMTFNPPTSSSSRQTSSQRTSSPWPEDEWSDEELQKRWYAAQGRTPPNESSRRAEADRQARAKAEADKHVEEIKKYWARIDELAREFYKQNSDLMREFQLSEFWLQDLVAVGTKREQYIKEMVRKTYRRAFINTYMGYYHEGGGYAKEPAEEFFKKNHIKTAEQLQRWINANVDSSFAKKMQSIEKELTIFETKLREFINVRVNDKNKLPYIPTSTTYDDLGLDVWNYIQTRTYAKSK